MKKTTILLLFILFTIDASAQGRNSFIAIRTGYSYPVGRYSSNDLDDGSFASIGINASVEGGWFFSSHFGIGGQAGINLHPLDLQELAIAKIEDDPFLSDLRIRSEEFQSITNTTGFYGTWSVRGKFNVNAKILSGIMYAKTPYQIYKPQYFLAGPEYYEITSAADYSLVFIGGTGIVYNALDYLDLILTGEYHYSKLTFRFNTANGVVDDHKVISFINLLFGLVIKI